MVKYGQVSRYRKKERSVAAYIKGADAHERASVSRRDNRGQNRRRVEARETMRSIQTRRSTIPRYTKDEGSKDESENARPHARDETERESGAESRMAKPVELAQSIEISWRRTLARTKKESFTHRFINRKPIVPNNPIRTEI